MHFVLETVDPKDPEIQQELFQFLAPQEIFALFLLGNLRDALASFMTVARKKGKVVGVMGYYPTFRSFTLFTQDAEISCAFASYAATQYEVDVLLGVSHIVKPALDELLKRGRKLIRPERQAFLSLEMKDFIPLTTLEGTIRPIVIKDIDRVCELHRLLHGISKNTPITDEERERVRSCSIGFGLELEGKIVSVASTNGLAIKAFMLLGVVTDPAFRRRGFAQTVCTHLIDEMRKRGAERAILFTGHDNIAAIRCYEELGFRLIGDFTMALFQKR